MGNLQNARSSATQAKKSSLRPVERWGYASGNFAKSIVWNTLELFLIFYLTDLVGLPPRDAGLIVFLSLIWDAVLDPVIGFIADRTTTPIGRYGPFLLIGAPLCAISFSLVFSLPTAMAEHGMFWALGALLLFRSAYTLVDLPHNALIATLSNDSSERARLASLRFVFSSLAVFVLAVSSYFILSPDLIEHQQNRFRQFGLLVSVASAAVLVASWWSVRRFDRTAQGANHSISSQLRSLVFFIRDKDSRAVMLYAFSSALLVSVFGKGLGYFAKYELGNEALVSVGLAAMMIGQIAGSICLGRIASRYENAIALKAAGLMLLPATLVFFLSAPASAATLIGSCAVIGFPVGGIWALVWALAPNVVDKQQATCHTRAEGSYFGILIVIMKAATGLSAFLFGWLLTQIGFEPNVQQSDATLLWLRCVMCVLPSIGGISIFLIMSTYGITHANHSSLLTK
ncbi:MFS transporter [Hyphococcus luteus]|uniref:MFS transporter n=1 Tax=Hyphococcus luteus TaxID=2058213 RepID=A0A2S7K6X9_9PROT|nr:MFS transporter [Marinicaulis flavus]PQA88242.1 hypothetical protein CW354_08030 [Marinicaulis flavus]